MRATMAADKPCIIFALASSRFRRSAVSEPLTRAVRAATRDHPGTSPALPEANSEPCPEPTRKKPGGVRIAPAGFLAVRAGSGSLFRDGSGVAALIA